MQNYKPGTDVPLTFSLIDESGGFLTPTGIVWRVLDEAEVVLQAWTAVAVLPTTSGLTLTIPAALTVLIPPALRGLRTVEVELATPKGTVQLSDAVMLQGATALTFGINTFQTYAQALLESEDLIPEHIPGWTQAGREIREKALITAHQRILLLPLGAHFDTQQSIMTVDAQFPRSYGAYMLRDMSPAQILTLYPPFLAALRKAQVLEADDALNLDPVMDARKNGVTAITTGESSTFFRAFAPLDLPVGARALKQLQRWVRFGARVGRS